MSPAVNGDMETEDGGGVEVPKKAPPKHVTVEKIYQKKSQLEHILLRPDTYIGSVEQTTETMWVYDSESEAMVQKEISFVPGLYKIYDEILVNAADNKQRDPEMDCIKIDINSEENTISIWNNGQGIPVVEHKDEKMFVPTMIFGHLLTSSNYNDEEEKVTGGRNGYGAKLCNIFSSKFVVETSSVAYKRCFKQAWASNMSKTSEPKIKPSTSSDYTKITFCPDLSKFKMQKLDSDIVGLMSRRAFDVAASTRGVKVYLNGKKLPIKNFKDYIDLYIKDKEDEMGNPLKIIHEQVNPRWEVAITMSDKGFQQVSFVNSIATTKGGRHVDHVADALVKQMIDTLKKKNKSGLALKPFQIKNHMWLFVNCLIVNPTFDSQTKENMTLQAKSFGSKCTLSEKFIGMVSKSGIIEAILTWAKLKADAQLVKSCSGKKQTKLKGIPKLEDANDAGSKNSIDCTLILTEGDSAKSLAVSGLGVVGRDKYGVFPLKGKLLNVREATPKQILENAEIGNIIKILGLQYKKKYETMDDLKTLRYGRLMIMTDQDQDGSHIKGLIINFIHTNWPSLLKLPFLEEFITPIVKATKKNEELSFFSLPEFEEWKKNTGNWHTYKIKYYKGLGTSTSKEAKEYFSDMDRHRILFNYQGVKDDTHIQMAFSKKLVESRKEWLTSWMSECKRRAELGLPEDYLYTKTTKSVTYTDFINKELVLFSNMDNERSIPNMLDGLKPGSRKVLFTCLKRNDKREVKVAQLAGSVAEISAYHHGEMSLMSTIINLAQNYVGSNNINLLQPIGQFGTRLQGGKDAASSRYIFTMLSPLTRLIFHPHDDALLKYLKDDNQRIEPEWYIPIIPIMLVNGADGIGTGWMTKIPNHNPREIIEVLKKMMRDEDIDFKMKPWYKNFRGDIERLGPDRFVFSGEISVISDQKLEITELPIGTWTQVYKESVLEVLLHGVGEKQPPLIQDYKEYNTDTTVRFVVTMSRDKFIIAENEGLHKIFKLQSSYSISSMCCFDKDNVLRRFDCVMDIMKEFYIIRLDYYGKRKAYLEGILEAEARKLSNQARFIIEKCDGKLVVENKKKKALIEELVKRGYDSDPVKGWKMQQDKEAVLEEEGEKPEGTEPEEEEAVTTGQDFDYLLGMTMWSLTKEKKDELLRKRDEKQTELKILQDKSPKDLWVEDLDKLLEELDKVEENERKEEAKQPKGTKATLGKALKKKAAFKETMPSPVARRVQPVIDEEMKMKVEKLLQAKENKGKRTKKIKEEPDEKDEFDAMVDGQKTLNERLGTSPELIEKKVKNQKKATKQTKLDFKPKKAPGTPKKKRGKNVWSDESSEEKENSDLDDIKPSQPVRTISRRSAAANIKFKFNDSSDDDDEADLFDNVAVLNGDDDAPRVVTNSDPEFEDEKSEIMFDDDDEDEKPKKPSPKKKAKPASKLKSYSSGSDSDFCSVKYSKKDDEPSSDALFDSLLKSDTNKPTTSAIQVSSDENNPVKKKAAKAPAQRKPKKAVEDKPKAKKPAQKRPKKNVSDSETDFDVSSKTKNKKKKKAASESDSDSDFESKAPVRQTSARARKPTTFNFDSSDLDE